MQRRALEKRAQKDRARKVKEAGVSPPGVPLKLSDLPAEGSEKKIRAASSESSSSSYRPRWSVMEADSFGAPASSASKKVARELCGAFILPKDHPLYSTTDSVEAIDNLLGYLSLDAPWAAALADKVRDQDILLQGWEQQVRSIPSLECEVETLKLQLAKVRLENSHLKQENADLWSHNDKMMNDNKDMLEWLEAKKEEFRRSESPEP